MSDQLNILVVGAGGIGCELLKNLVLENFTKITVIDLDTIDISNLNRQFLFQRVHVGRSKAEVARESVLKFRPNCEITALHKSIFSSAFDTNFFSTFDLVFNALDNQAARRHVNRLCLAAKRPLIESGTAGYLGQVEPLLPAGLPSAFCASDGDCCSSFRTGCYECQPRGAGQRTFPACTIRNTPSEPIHCVVWAKYLFNQLFGEPDVDDEDISPDPSDPDLQRTPVPEPSDTEHPKLNGQSMSNGINDRVTLRDWFTKQWDGCRQSSKLTQSEVDSVISPAVHALCWRLFHQDIVTLVGMRDLWVDRQDRREPSPLLASDLSKALEMECGLSAPARSDSNCPSMEQLRDQRRLSSAGWLRTFMNSVQALQLRLVSSSSQPLVWDKDDTEAMDFVASAAILRAQLFHLPGASELSRFVTKSLAGNIIPAIATTNAVIAGLMVLQARHILAGAEKHVRTVYLHRQPTGRPGNRRLVVPCEPPVANPSCLVCSTKATQTQLGLVCVPTELTLRILRDRILIRHLGMLAPDVELEDRGVILISSEEGETDEDTLNKTLSEFHVGHGSRLSCDDFRQEFTVQLNISAVTPEVARADTQSAASTNNAFSAHDSSEGWHLVGDVDSLLAEVGQRAEQEIEDKKEALNGSSGSHAEVAILSDEEGETSPRPVKRPRLSSEADTYDASIDKVRSSPLPLSPNPVASKLANLESSIPIHAVIDNEDEDDDLIMLD
ncbi:E1 ubiquitin-activating protein uba2 [Clonorchis sinensis]|uniref:E1 ubiquitin-activating protein uba2 n=1 Tax=Clonorchis sinensis TaxID=79923 RepID=A0A8T1N243_CLOSI|nr:E1 ubiquitin-activating protein uba2 [Clonorchis sinensis]